jgi:hypothetical protein
MIYIKKDGIYQPINISFVNGRGVSVNPQEDCATRKVVSTIGEAYAFFDCDASKEQIEIQIPELRKMSKTPNNLQLLLQEGISGLKLDRTLVKQLNFPAEYRVASSERRKVYCGKEKRPLASMKYALRANCPGISNEDTASELSDIMNGIFGTCNRDSDMGTGAVVYKTNDGEYDMYL